MIQRLQSLWLLLAATFNGLTFRFPFFTGDWMKDATPYIIDLKANTTTWLTIFTAITAILAFITIFFFKNRKLQLSLCYMGIFLAAVLIAMYFLEIANFYNGSVTIWAVIYFFILIFFILAARGIWKDQKLVKSMDRLR
jgi:hypothetical protein